MTIPEGCIYIDPKHRDMPVAKAKIERRAAWSMASRGITTLGDLHGRPWATLAEFLFIREKAVELVAARLEDVATDRIRGVVPVTTLHTPADTMRWLLAMVPHRRKHFALAERHLVDRETLDAIATSLDRSKERVRQRVALARNTARMRLPEVPAWRPMLARAVAVVDELVAVSDVALYGVLARELGWGEGGDGGVEGREDEVGDCYAAGGGDGDGDGGPTTADLRAMCALLAMVGPLVVVRREELVVLCRDEKSAWARIRMLERADDDEVEDLRLALPDELQAAFMREMPTLRDLGGRRRRVHPGKGGGG